MSYSNTSSIYYPPQHQTSPYQLGYHHEAETNTAVNHSAGIMEAIPVPSRSLLTSANLATNTPEDLVPRSRLNGLVREIDSNLTMETEVEDVLLAYADDFLDRLLTGASMIAQNRNVNTIEVKDVQQFLNRNYAMWVPGFGTDELRPYRKNVAAEAHRQRMALIRKVLKKY